MERCHQDGVSVAGVYYAHGLKCAKYPAQFIVFVAVVTVVCSLPFFVTSTGDINSPKPWRSPWLNYRLPSAPVGEEGGAGGRGNRPTSDWIIDNPSLMSVRTPLWFIGLPQVIFQQIYVDVQLDCSNFADLCQNTQQQSLSKKTMALMVDSLLTVERTCSSVMHPAVSKFTRLHGDRNSALPSFISSILSPLHDTNFQQKDASVKENVSLHTVKELLYGGFWESSHSHLTHKRNSNYKEQRFAVTFALSPTIENFNLVTDCVEALNNIWPLETNELSFMKHIYYESEWTLSNFAPLICLYSIVFLYISFSVGKIDLVRSKLGLGFTAVITVLFSLTMSLGICTFFGLSITLSGSEIFPFVVVVIGLENILIITKAVISTDPGLEVKYRIAEGLGREGRALTKNLITILCLVIMGIFAFNYAMKEFCIIALVGLLCDYFLHITFFTTVLSIDLRRMELTELSFHVAKPLPSVDTAAPERIWRRISKRDRVNNFLVRNRFAQRFFGVVLFIYFMSVISHTERFHSLVSHVMPTQPSKSHSQSTSDSWKISIPIPYDVPDTTMSSDNREQTVESYINGILGPDFQVKDKYVSFRSSEDGFSLPCGDSFYCWRSMVTTHWPRLLSFYNATLEKRFITILPPIMLNHRLGFTTQKLFSKTSSSKDLLVALTDVLDTLLSIPNVVRGTALLIVSLIVVVYLIILSQEASRTMKKKVLREKETQKLTTVFKLRGHVQDIECLSVTNGNIASASLDGMVYIWDFEKRECIMAIDRRELRLRDYRDTRHVEGCESSDIKSTSPSIPTASSLSSLHNSNKFNNPHPSPQSPPTLPHPKIQLPLSPSVPSSSSTPTTMFPIPQRIIPGFLKRFSMPTIGTILRRSPEKPEKQIQGEDGLQETKTPPISDSYPPNASLPSPIANKHPPLRQGFTVPSNSSGPSSLGSSNSTKAITTYSRPLVSHTELSNGSKKSVRSLSMESSSATGGGGGGAGQVGNESASVSNWSAESVSIVSEDTSDLSYGTPETGPSPLPPVSKDPGFQFTRHFSFYSQFTSELALTHYPSAVDDLWETFAPSAVWCMDYCNGTVVIGCGNGQLEVWNSFSGSLKFCLFINLPGITVIKSHPVGIISGHLDGSLQLTGHHGQLMHGVQAHRGPVTALCHTGDCVISGGSDAVIKVYRVSDFMYLRRFTPHQGSIVTLSLVDSELCLSACVSGTVCLWEYKTACISHELDCRTCDETTSTDRTGEGNSCVTVRACCNANYIVALLRDNTVHVWNRNDGYLSNIIEMGQYSHDVTAVGPNHFAIALQDQVVVYDIASRREVTRKDLESIGMPIVRHLTSFEPSMLICTTGREVQLIPTGLKIKTE